MRDFAPEVRAALPANLRGSVEVVELAADCGGAQARCEELRERVHEPRAARTELMTGDNPVSVSVRPTGTTSALCSAPAPPATRSSTARTPSSSSPKAPTFSRRAGRATGRAICAPKASTRPSRGSTSTSSPVSWCCSTPAPTRRRRRASRRWAPTSICPRGGCPAVSTTCASSSPAWCSTGDCASRRPTAPGGRRAGRSWPSTR